MEDVYDRGRALAEAFAAAGHPRDTALVIDLHGSRGGGGGGRRSPTHFAPVFTFDNWPHPRGVVPSHETLGRRALLPAVAAARGSAALDARAAGVRARRESAGAYRDEVAHFDNRYAVSLPSRRRCRRSACRASSTSAPTTAR